MRLVFLGSGAFGLPTLERLAASHEITAVVTQPDRKAGRGRKLTPTPIGAWAQGRVDTIIKAESVNVPDVRERIRRLDADAWVVIAFGQKLKRKLLDNIFAINLHASLLPRWRGAAPIHHAVLAGDEVTGNSVISLASRMDAGLIYAQSTRPIEPHLTTGELHDLLASDGPDLVSRVLEQHARGRLDPVEQDESMVTLAPQLSKADGLVDFGQSAAAVLRRIHGLSPWPGAAAFLGGDRLGLHRAEVIDGDSETPGDAVGRLDADGGVACATGRIRLLEVQPAGKRRMSFDDFARGHNLKPGDRLRGEPAC